MEHTERYTKAKLFELGAQKRTEDFCVVQCSMSILFRSCFARVAEFDREPSEVFEQVTM